MASKISAGRTPAAWLGRFDLGVLLALGVLAAVMALQIRERFVYRWDWPTALNFVLRYDAATGWHAGLLLQGFGNTLRIALLASLIAAVIGILVALARISKVAYFNLLGTTYVEIIRNLPPLVFLFIVYFFLSAQITAFFSDVSAEQGPLYADNSIWAFLIGPTSRLPQTLAGTLCLGLFEAAFVAEIVRSGIASIGKGQWEGGSSLGLTRGQALRLIIVPQAIRRTTPPLAGQFISLIKDSSIVSLVSIQELTFMGSEVASSTGRTFETWIIVSLFYLAVCLALSRVVARLERRADPRAR